MIITDQFVMLNWPKSGSTFARAVFKQIHAERDRGDWRIKLRLRKPSCRDYQVILRDIERIRYRKAQHGTYCQIPVKDRGKRVISIARNPLSRYVSTYFYRYWVKFPHTDLPVLEAEFSSWPNLSFEEYHEMLHKYGRKNRLRGIQPRIDIGHQSIQFIQMYFKDPDTVLRRIDDEYIEGQEYLNDIADVQFLHQENLRAELKEFLLEMGYRPEEAAVAETLEKKRVSDRKGDDRPDMELYSPDLLEKVLKRDALLFKLFPEYAPAATGTSQPSGCR